MRLGRLLLPVFCALALGVGSATAADVGAVTAPALVVGTGIDKIAVTSRFTGRELLVFGALSHPGAVVVVLRSPPSALAVTQKVQTGPIWLTGQKVTVQKLPGVVQMTTYLIRDGQVLAQSNERIDVEQVGLEQWVADVAEREPWLFGIGLTLLLAVLGLGLGIVMQRRSGS